MEIEKVTFYKMSQKASRSYDHGKLQGVIEISLPRVKWLETDGPYRPEWAIDYTPPEEPVEVIAPERPRFRIPRPDRVRKVMALTEMETKVFDLHKQGLSYREIMKHFGVSSGSAKDALYRAKVKLGLAESASRGSLDNSSGE